MSDPAHARCVVHAVQQGRTRRGEFTANLMASTASLLSNFAQAHSHTPPTSNWSATIWQLQGDIADNDVASAVFTDEEGSVGLDF